jgi:hypothetical protein
MSAADFEPIGESLLSDSTASAAPGSSPASLASVLLGGARSNSALLGPDRVETSVAVKALVVALLGAAVGWAGAPLLGDGAMSWLFVLWVVSELSMRYGAALLSSPAAQPAMSELGGVITDITSSVYAVAGRLCVFVFAVVVAHDLRENN